MNERRALARGRAPASAAGELGAAARSGRAARRGSVCTAGRGRSVGSSSDRRRAGELLAPVGELRLQHLARAASSRCQTAKSAYWIGSSGSGEGRPRRRPRRAPPARATRTPSDQPSATMWCRSASSTCSSGAEAQQERPRSSGPRGEVERPRGASSRPAARPRPRAPPAAGRARSTTRQRAAAPAAATTWTGSPVDRGEGGAQRPRGGARSRSRLRAQRRDVERPARARSAHGDVVGGAAGLELVEEPEPLLGEGERQRSPLARHAATSGGVPRRPRRRAGAARSRAASAADGRAPRRASRSGSSTPSRSRSRDDHLRRQQRVAAEVEEVVVRRRPARRPQHLGPDAGEQLLDRRRAARTCVARGRAPASGAGSAGGPPCRWA